MCIRDRDMEDVKSGQRYIMSLANITEIRFIQDREAIPEDVMSAVAPRAEVFIPLDDLLDYQAELLRLEKEKERLSGEIRCV